MRVVLQVQGDQYFPEVKNKNLFTYVNQQSNTTKKPKLKSNEGTIKSCLDEIALENKRLLNAYTQISKSLNGMIAAKEITKNHLIDLFIKFFPQTTVPKPGEAYLSSLDQRNNKPIPMTVSSAKDQEIHLLIHSLSVWVATDQVDGDALFEFLENR